VIAKDAQGDIAALQMRLAELDLERERVLAALDRLKQSDALKPDEPNKSSAAHVPSASTMSNADKVALFRSRFRGREDIFPRRWENAKTGKSGYSPACANEWVRGICEKPRIKCMECPNQAFIPVSDDIVRSHLQGRDSANPKRTDSFVAGVYPLMPDETCWFLVADFDKQAWRRDALAHLATCRERHVPAALERSRSGNGAHVWIFFAEPVPASQARRLGAHLITCGVTQAPLWSSWHKRTARNNR
jgi:hypothetical protein